VRKRLCLAGLLLTFGCAAALAQATPKLNSLSREWFQRGSTNEVIFAGENLRGLKRFHVSGDPGVKVVLALDVKPVPPIVVESSRGGIGVSSGEDPNRVRAQVIVSDDAPLTSREVRAITGTGVSNPLRIELSVLPEILESRKGSDAQVIDLPVGISGVISAPDEQDAYQFRGKKGQELTFDLLAFRMGSPLDSSMVILNGAGQELARSEDAKGFDSFIRFQVPEDGRYVLQLRDFRYEGSPRHKYHLTAGALPYVDSAFPVGGQRGHAVEVALRGSNLGDLNHVTLQPGANAPLGWQEIRVRTPQGLSSPFPFNVSDLPEMSETEPNSATNQANAVMVPGIINGQIDGANDIDYFQFAPRKTETLICEVTAQRLGSPLDALLTLRDSTGKILRRNDDAEGADARIAYEFQKDQEYTLALRDLLGRGGSDYVYRLSIRPPEPDFTVRYSPDTPRLNCGGRTFVRCEVARRAGFNGAVRITGEDLPPGISAEAVLISEEEPNAALLWLTASSNALPGSHPLKIVGTGSIEGTVHSHAAEPASGENGVVQEGLLTVLETPPPFTIGLMTLSLVMDQGQSGTLDVVVHRREGFNGEIKLLPEGFSSGREPLTRNVAVDPVTLKPGETQATFKMRARIDSETGRRPIYVRGEAKANGETVVQYSPSLPLTVHEIPFALENTMKRLSIAVLPPDVESAASEAEFTVRASRRGWFTDQINLKLEGLPEGVIATSTNLPSRVGEVTFKLTTTNKAPPAKEFQIIVVGSADVANRNYEQRTVPMTLSITKSQAMADTK
jgi:hypothetical protein